MVRAIDKLKYKQMKKLFLLCGFVLMAGFAHAQPDIIRNTFEKYRGQTGFVLITLTGDMLNMALEMVELNLDTTFQSRIDEVIILAYEDSLNRGNVNLFNELYSRIDKNIYSEMVNVTEEGNDMSLLANRKDGSMSEFILIAGGKKQNAVIYGKGDIMFDEAMKVIGGYLKDRATVFMKTK